MNHNARCVGSEIIDLADLDFAFLVRFEDRLNDLGGGSTERYLGDDKGLVIVRFLYACTYLDRAATFAVVVFGDINNTSRGKIREELELFVPEVRQGSVAEFVEVMRQYFRVQTDRNTFYALCEQQRELNRQMNRLVLTSVIGFHPLGSLGIEDRFECELGEPCFDITGRSRSVAGKDVTPVTLTINEEVFLAQLNQCIPNGGITVRVILHGLTDDVSHFVVLTIIDGLHSMQNTTLHRLESILNRRHSALQNHIRGIIQEPILVHARQVILHRIIESPLGSHLLSKTFVDKNVCQNTCYLQYHTGYEQPVLRLCIFINYEANNA